MTPYRSKSGKSRVAGYEIGDTYITVVFVYYAPRTYSYAITGTEIVEKMKSLALAQEGLSRFIDKENPVCEW
ncbi:MAG: hypothetical protein WDM71_06490 [Ferruginibacter sp.]